MAAALWRRDLDQALAAHTIMMVSVSRGKIAEVIGGMVAREDLSADTLFRSNTLFTKVRTKEITAVDRMSPFLSDAAPYFSVWTPCSRPSFYPPSSRMRWRERLTVSSTTTSQSRSCRRPARVQRPLFRPVGTWTTQTGI